MQGCGAGKWLSEHPTFWGLERAAERIFQASLPLPSSDWFYQGWQGWGWRVLWQEIHFSPEYPKLSPDGGQCCSFIEEAAVVLNISFLVYTSRGHLPGATVRLLPASPAPGTPHSRRLKVGLEMGQNCPGTPRLEQPRVCG